MNSIIALTAETVWWIDLKVEFYGYETETK